MNRRSRRSCQSGFSLLEVLITMAIIAIGLMGFAAMMVQSMKNNRIAMQRSVATFYAYDIIDCMRANQSAAVSGNYNIDFTDSAPSCTTVATCDVNLWRTELSNLLPSGQGKISFPTGNTVLVEIRWAESLNASDDAIHTWKTVSTL